ncbi:hypothetical protein [Stigmatella aurantiaca]|uniref:Conserved uncharacterized protein n=1 Tax=Stigmatella aurantiaca (strain DW4/3-1) TaxID=378806 RepID=Q094W3_STIAD|nr:hypothetical protein [Stigmatella aurantiaca]ADO71359.1 conserved uncharacterized protein [Stigmatella aurantiaca DW4/3-1]EAU67281.1 hypothetical protein STIAU_4963 [Stigmatella aurantiaca DW4/3-1]
MAIDAALEARIHKALAECEDEARSSVMTKHFGNRGPTHQECSESVGVDSHGRHMTRAMQLGIEQHDEALQCAQEKLQELKPDGFSISPRYHLDFRTGKVQYLSPDQVKAQLDSGRSAELRGSLEPDIVIHTGSPLQIQRVFDFKFPCVNDGRPAWREYPRGHPHQDLTQKQAYESVLKARAFRVIPRWGVLE